MRGISIIAAVGIVVGVSLVLVRARSATSDDGAGAGSPPPADTPPADGAGEPFVPFQLTPAGHGEIAFEDLPPEEQAVIEETMERGDADSVRVSGNERAELSRQAGEAARANAAAMSLGLEGFAGEGVVP